MTGRVLALTRAPRGRLALAAGLGAFTVCCGIGLMATAGYLISRAAERPAILSLTVAIVGVRFFGLARPLARYLERLASHDVAFRVLGRVRVRVFRRIEPLAPTQLDCYRRGDLLSRFVADVDALQDIQLRGTIPVLAAVGAGTVAVAVAAAMLPAAAVVLGAGLLVGGIAVPLGAGALGRRAARLEAGARGELSAELVELIAGCTRARRLRRRPGPARARPRRRSPPRPARGPRGARGRRRRRPPTRRHGRDGRGRPRRRGLGPRRRAARPRADRRARPPRAGVLRGRPAARPGCTRAAREPRRRPQDPGADRPRARGLRPGRSGRASARRG